MNAIEISTGGAAGNVGLAQYLPTDGANFPDYQQSFVADGTVTGVVLPSIGSLPANAGDFFIIVPSGLSGLTVTAGDPIIGSATISGSEGNASKEFIAIGYSNGSGFWLAR